MKLASGKKKTRALIQKEEIHFLLLLAQNFLIAVYWFLTQGWAIPFSSDDSN